MTKEWNRCEKTHERVRKGYFRLESRSFSPDFFAFL